jgi:Putative beta-barrel porin 2
MPVRLSGALVGLLALPCLLSSAQAQTLTKNVGDQPFNQGAKKLQAKKPSDFGSGGYTVAPGVILNSTIYSEAGHDSNPDEQFNEISAPYLKEGGSIGLTAIGEKGAANVVFSGAALQLFDDNLRGDRYDAGVSANGVYLLAPGVTLAGGGYFNHQGFEFIEDETTGAFTELGLETENVTAFVRGRYINVDYLTTPPVPAGVPLALRPLFDIDNFDAQRGEVTTGVLVGNRQWVGLYGEVSGAVVDYTDQQLPTVIDRNADDYYAKIGLRITPSATLQADIGWRWNRREFDNWAATPDFTSDFFDASLRWTPWSYFSLYASVDRIIGEPSQAISRAADTKSYAVGFSYIPFDRVALSANYRREIIDELGAPAKFRRDQISAELTYDISRRWQFYTGLLYDFTEEDVSDADYERLRVGAGLRILLTEKEGGSQSLGSHLAHLRQGIRNFNAPADSTLDISVGYSWFDLPSTNMTTVIGGRFFDQALTQLEDHDGDVDGVRVDARLDRFAKHTTRSGHMLTFGAQAFYAQYHSTDRSQCDFTLTTDCAFVNIVDFDPLLENNTGPFGRLRTTTEKDVRYWGVGLDARPGRYIGGGLKDDVPHFTQSPFRFGVSFRALTQDTDLHSVDISVPDPVDYKEDLETLYYGAYVGFDHALPLGHGFKLSLTAEAGAYYARTDYEGRYLAYVPVGGAAFILERGAVDDNDTEPAFIGSLRVDLDKQFDWGTIGLFGQGEYLSYVPEVRINNNDNAGGSPFGVVGTQRGTRLDQSDAFNYTVGLKVRVPLNGN